MADLQVKLKDLMREKSMIEQDIMMLQESSSPGPLIDAEGFPRGDIDVHSERITRNQIAMRQNDHKAHMKKIEETMFAYHSELKKDKIDNDKKAAEQAKTAAAEGKQKADSDRKTDSTAPKVAGGGVNVALNQLDAFYVCDLVEEGSPAKSAGLCIGDKVLQFGSILKRNTHQLKLASSMQEVVGHSINKPIKVVVHRIPEGVLDLVLTPRPWEGRGVLGCRLVDIKE